MSGRATISQEGGGDREGWVGGWVGAKSIEIPGGRHPIKSRIIYVQDIIVLRRIQRKRSFLRSVGLDRKIIDICCSPPNYWQSNRRKIKSNNIKMPFVNRLMRWINIIVYRCNNNDRQSVFLVSANSYYFRLINITSG